MAQVFGSADVELAARVFARCRVRAARSTRIGLLTASVQVRGCIGRWGGPYLLRVQLSACIGRYAADRRARRPGNNKARRPGGRGGPRMRGALRS
jgi:hypothetical protein